MTRSEFREKVIELLYVVAVGGDYDRESVDEEINQRIDVISANESDIDKVISDNLVGYTIDRLNFVDLAIIRNAVFELTDLAMPKEIVINEAIKLTKKFSNLDDDAAKRFNNKLLDNITKSLGK